MGTGLIVDAADVRKARTRRDLVQPYARLIRTDVVVHSPEVVREINLAIIARWSPAGLDWIKREAWRIAARKEPR